MVGGRDGCVDGVAGKRVGTTDDVALGIDRATEGAVEVVVSGGKGAAEGALEGATELAGG